MLKKKKCILPMFQKIQNSEIQGILLIVPNREGWHYFAVKKLSPLSKDHGDLPLFFWNRKRLESHKKVCKNKNFCNVIMPSEDTTILEFNKYQNLLKQHLLFKHILNV